MKRLTLVMAFGSLVACTTAGGRSGSGTAGADTASSTTGDPTGGGTQTSTSDSDSTDGTSSSTGEDSGSTGDEEEGLAWPNEMSQANSDPWLSDHHDEITVMRPRFLVINFANGLGVGGNDEIVPDSRLSEAELQAKAEGFLTLLREGSRYHASTDPGARPFLEPEIVKVVDLSDSGDHANSALFPRGQLIESSPGYRTVGYYDLFSDEYAPHWGYTDDDGRPLRLDELVDRGIIHEVIMMANQVDGRDGNPPDQVTSNILEVAMVAQAYDENLDPIPGEFVKNGTPHERQKEDMAQATSADHNSMPWTGRSLRIYFLNASRGVGCLAHSLGHEFEYRYNESTVYSPGTAADGASINPYLQPEFRRFAGFDLDTAHGAPFPSLYAGGDSYSYEDCDPEGVCDTLRYGDGVISSYRAGCGNTHYPPGASFGYDYEPADSVRSFCETFGMADEAAEPISPSAWSHVTTNPEIDGDCGGKFLTFWYQNMPGWNNAAFDAHGQPAKNWWVFMYY